MTRRSTFALAFLAALAASATIATRAQTTAPASAPPKGDVTQYTFSNSQIFPGTTRDYWIYVPKQYDGSKPACLFVDQDSVQFNAPVVFDQLIASGEMPVTIGVFVAPGKVKAPNPQAADRLNRSYEFDSLSDDYVRFLINELLPDAEKKTAGNRPIRLSRNPDDRAIGGSSSGAIASFTAAWERPDSFHRVFSAIGTYVDLRGGNIYPSLIRKFNPKPIRIFLQDGSSDNNTYGGDWWMANQTMERALTYAGYEVNHAWDSGTHSSAGGTAVFADAMRWLWKGYPAPVKTGLGSEKLQEILIPGEEWKQVEGTYEKLDGPTVNAAGEVLFNDVTPGKTYKIGLDGKVSLVASDSGRTGQAWGPDGRLYYGNFMETHAVDSSGKTTMVTNGFRVNDLTVAANGTMYLTESGMYSQAAQVWSVSAKGERKVIDATLKFPNGITLSPDQTMLYVSDSRTHWVYSYQIQADGSVMHKERFFDLYFRDTDDDAGGDAMRVDADGRLYVTSRAGIQICDTQGKVNVILTTPNGRNGALTFGGANQDMLYVLAGDRVYVRKVKVKGVLPFLAPVAAVTATAPAAARP